MRLVPHPLADQADEVGRPSGELEADQVRAEEALEDLAAPGSCWNSSLGGNGMWR